MLSGCSRSADILKIIKTIEARALALFTPRDGILHELCSQPSISIPQLLHHDAVNNVLVMSDLGRLMTLSTYLSSLHSGPPSEESRCYQLGSRLGQFFARLHSPETLQKLNKEYLAQFTEFTTDDLVYQTVVEPLEDKLKTFHVHDASLLADRVKEYFKREDRVEEKSFILGDLWTGVKIFIRLLTNTFVLACRRYDDNTPYRWNYTATCSGASSYAWSYRLGVCYAWTGCRRHGAIFSGPASTSDVLSQGYSAVRRYCSTCSRNNRIVPFAVTNWLYSWDFSRVFRLRISNFSAASIGVCHRLCDEIRLHLTWPRAHQHGALERLAWSGSTQRKVSVDETND